jgi:cyclohexanone monooxygenase
MTRTTEVLDTTSDLNFDIDALRQKYRDERQKRLKTEGIHQYTPASDFKSYSEDPWVNPGLKREPLRVELDVLIIGGGFSGLCAGAYLRQAGIDNFRIVDRAADFGGVWYYNRYPGVQCDIESYCYLPLLEETGYIPSEKYAHGAEILEHARRIGRTFDLYDRALFQTTVAEARWDEGRRRWHVTSDRGDHFDARFVILTIAPLDRPKLPSIPGIDEFEGHTFHASRWDFDYTGGHSRGEMTRLADKTVAVIGTGASAVQCIPYLGEDAKHLYVIQRTPSTVGARGNKPTDPQWAKSLKPGWRRERLKNYIAITAGHQRDVDYVDDGWTKALRDLGGFSAKTAKDSPLDPALQSEINDFNKMNEERRRIDEIVDDPAVAESLKPWHRFFCKRPTFNDHYYATFNRPNVTLVDTMGQGPDCITKDGIVFSGKEYKVDCIIFATGFEFSTTLKSRIGFDLIGAGGQPLSEIWKNGLRTFHGMTTHGFPNLFQTGVSQNGVSFCTTHDLDEQASHIVYIIRTLRERGLTRIEATADAERDWIKSIREKDPSIREFLESCTPGYYNFEGNREGRFSVMEEAYGPGPYEFCNMLEAWRDEGSLRGFECL